MEHELQFIIMIDTVASLDSVVKYMKKKLLREIPSAHSTFHYRGNQIDIMENEDSDALLSKDKEDGFLSYAYQIEYMPFICISLKEQINIAQEMLMIARNKYKTVEIGATFEEYLNP